VIDLADSYTKLSGHAGVKKIFRAVAIARAQACTVGVLGEIFVVIEPFANLDIEKKLGEMRVEVRRGVWLSDCSMTGQVQAVQKEPDSIRKKTRQGYLNYPAGGKA